VNGSGAGYMVALSVAPSIRVQVMIAESRSTFNKIVPRFTPVVRGIKRANLTAALMKRMIYFYCG
jgi:hypothetical protein